VKGFDFEETRLTQEITKLGAKRVLLQLPEGLKPDGPRLAKAVENAGALAIISADPCYGACDIASDEAESLGVDLIVHFGHARFLAHERIPTIYVEARSTVPVDAAVEKALPLLSTYIRIGLATSVQHLQALNKAREILTRAGKTVVIGDSGQMSYPGQVLGCNYSNVKSIAAEVDAFLFVGGGLFHALGVALSASKPTVIADPYDNRAYSIDAETQKIIKQRWTSIEEAKKAKTFGIIIGLKPGQKKADLALKTKSLAQKHGFAVCLLAAKEITPETLLEFPSIDAYVNTACTRISLDAPEKFSKPVLTVNEFMVAVGESTWENALKKGLFES
jgi:2-(3-amino-3-carboxypropyl)histidine synthase